MVDLVEDTGGINECEDFGLLYFLLLFRLIGTPDVLHEEMGPHGLQLLIIGYLPT